MQSTTCWETADRAKAQLSKEVREALIERSFRMLDAQFMAAVRSGMLEMLLPTPDYADSVGGQRQATAAAVITDLLNGTDADEVLTAIFKILSDAALGKQVQLRSTVLLARLSGTYADRHAAAHALGEDA
jgi:hypothetical protein